METGTKTTGRLPRVVPSKPRGPTPTMVSDCPLTVMTCPTTDGSDPNLDSHALWLRTVTKCAPGASSSAGARRRPSVGVSARVGK